MGTNRLESFSDGVIAVAITLLVLGITVPNPNAHPHRSLLFELGTHWPDYAAYAVSFVTIGIIWINHHAMINRLRDADYTILILNLLLLMSIGILPFATDLMATYLRDASGRTAGRGGLRGRAAGDVADVRLAEPDDPAQAGAHDRRGGADRATAPDPVGARS